MRQQLIVLVFVFFLGLVGGYLWGSGQEPDLGQVPIVRYMPFDVSTAKFKPTTPDITTEFRPLERGEVRIDTVEVPVEVERYVISERQQAISVTPRQVEFKYFDPETRRWGIDLYEVPDRRFDLKMYLDAYVWDFQWHEPTVGLLLEARYRNLHLGIGPYYMVGENQLLLQTTLRYNLF